VITEITSFYFIFTNIRYTFLNVDGFLECSAKSHESVERSSRMLQESTSNELIPSAEVASSQICILL